MGRAPCCDKVGLKKGPWQPEEDQKLIAYIQEHGHENWRALPKKAGLLRCGKSCRLRWTNYLRPDIKRGGFSAEEDRTIIQLHEILGNRWSVIAAHMPGRTDNEIKNYWNTHLRKQLLQMGIDPTTHRFMHTISNSSVITQIAMWESARLQAEARLAREYLTFVNSQQQEQQHLEQPKEQKQDQPKQQQHQASIIPNDSQIMWMDNYFDDNTKKLTISESEENPRENHPSSYDVDDNSFPFPSLSPSDTSNSDVNFEENFIPMALDELSSSSSSTIIDTTIPALAIASPPPATTTEDHHYDHFHPAFLHIEDSAFVEDIDLVSLSDTQSMPNSDYWRAILKQVGTC